MFQVKTEYQRGAVQFAYRLAAGEIGGCGTSALQEGANVMFFFSTSKRMHGMNQTEAASER